MAKPFTYFIKNSERFRNLLGPTLYAFRKSHPMFFKAYIELYNPTYWNAQALNVQKKETPTLLKVADMIEKQQLHQPLERLYYRFYRDYSDFATWADKHITKQQKQLPPILTVTHALRLALIQLLFTYAARIPQICTPNARRTRKHQCPADEARY